MKTKHRGVTEVRDEYDFSKGIRGKYHKRVAESSKVVIFEPALASRDVALASEERAEKFVSSNRGKNLVGKAQVAVEPRTSGRWAVQTDGTQRADSVHDRKSDAVARGRELAENKRGRLVIKNESGRIVGKDSQGKDSRRRKA